MSFGLDLGGGLSLNTSTGGIGMDLGSNLVLDVSTGSIGQKIGDTGITIFPDVAPSSRKTEPSPEAASAAKAGAAKSNSETAGKPKGFWARLFG
jgi:hypothetical protein